MRRPFLFIVLALLITTILIIFDRLGGFNEPEISYESINAYLFAGRHFQGPTEDPAVEHIFNEMKTIRSEQDIQGALTMIWLDESTDVQDTVDVFIGIEMQEDDDFPAYLDSLQIAMHGLIRARIEGHSSVLPTPESVIHSLREYASENKYELQDYVIDKYLSDTLIYTEIPVK